MIDYFYDSILTRLQPELLKRIGQVWGADYQHDLVAAIQAGLADADKVRQAIDSLRPFEQATLRLLKYHGKPISASSLIIQLRMMGVKLYKINYRYSNEVNDTLRELISRGVMMRMGQYDFITQTEYYSHEEELYFSDSRLLAQVGKLRPQSLPIKATEDDAPSSYRRPQAVILDLINTVQAAETMGEFSLTKAGTVRVAALRQFRKLLGWKADDQTIDGFTFNDMPNALLHAMLYAGLLTQNEEGSNHSLIFADSMERFLHETPESQIQRWLAGFRDITQWNEGDFNISTYQHASIKDGRRLLMVALAALPTDTDGFFSFDAFDQAICERVGGPFALMHHPLKPQSRWTRKEESPQEKAARLTKVRERWLTYETVLLRRALSTWLYYLGIVELQIKHNEPTGLRLTALGRSLFHPDLVAAEASPVLASDSQAANEAWLVLPNFDIVVYLDRATPEQLIFLEQHAKRTQLQQHTAQYHLSRDSVYVGLQAGSDIATISERLQAGASKALPQNVLLDLQEWGRLYEQMTLYYEADLYEFADASQRDQALQGQVRGTPVGERFLLVSDNRSAQIFTGGTVIDYRKPLPRCLFINERGHIKLKDSHDLLIASQLDKWAEPQGNNQWQLTQTSVKRGLQGKAKIEDLLTLLDQRLLVKKLPALLKIMLESWDKQTKIVVNMATLTLLYCSDKALLKMLRHSRTLKPFIKGHLDGLALVIDPAQLSDLQAALAQFGITIDEVDGFIKR